MKSKALQKQLIAAVAMVLVAAIAVSSSTYAWFAQNTAVTAEKVTVTAQTAKNLSISLDNSNWSTSAALTDPAATYWPISASENNKAIGTTASGTLNAQDGVNFYIIKAANKVQSADDKAATVAFNDATLADAESLAANFEADTTNFWTDDIYLRYEYTDGETTPIDAKVTVLLPAGTVAGDLKIEKAMHVAFATEALGWKNIDLTSAAFHAADAAHDNKPYVEASLTSILTLTANTPQLVKAYIWFEGEDTDCFTNNAVAPKAMTTSLEFSIPTT